MQLKIGEEVRTTSDYKNKFGKDIEGKLMRLLKSDKSYYGSVEIKKPDYLEGNDTLVEMKYLEKNIKGVFVHDM